MIVCYHRLTAKRNKKKKRKARIVFVRGATLIANTLRKHKPLFLCTYIYVSLTLIVFCKTTSRNLHTWHFKSQERRTRHSARIEPKTETRELSVQPCKVFQGNPTMDSTFRIPGTGFRIPCQGNLDFGGFATQAKKDVATKILRLLVQYALKGQEPKQPVGNSWEFLVI